MAKILIADDDDDILELYSLTFEEDGHEIIKASNGAAAIRLTKEKNPDIAILDIGMPEITGLEALKEISTANGGTPVIVNTAYPLFRRDFRSHLAAEWVSKTARLDVLRNAVEKHLKKKGREEGQTLQ